MFEAFAVDTIFNISHAGSYNQTQVQLKVKELLIQNTTDRFTSQGFAQGQIAYNSPFSNTSEVDIDITFSSPTAGSIISYGSEIEINATSDGAPEQTALIIGENFFNNDVAEVFNGNEIVYTYEVTPKKLGELKIGAMSTQQEAGAGVKVISVQVTTDQIPSLIEPSQSTVVEVGKTSTVPFIAHFPEFGKIRLGSVQSAEYEFEHGYAEYIGNGIIRGLTSGTDTLRVIFNGVESEPMRILILDEDDITSTNFLSKPQSKVGSFDIFPNPSKGQITIKFDSSRLQEHTISIFDARGRVANTVNHSANAGENLVNLNLSNLPSGLYLMRIKGKDQNLIQRFIKS